VLSLVPGDELEPEGCVVIEVAVEDDGDVGVDSVVPAVLDEVLPVLLVLGPACLFAKSSKLVASSGVC